MNTVAQLARHALDNSVPVTLIGIHAENLQSLSHFTHVSNIMEHVQDKTCLILDVIQTFSSSSLLVAQDVAEKFNTLQNKLQSHNGCLALASQERDLVCLLYPPSSTVDLDVGRFYSADIAALTRVLFPSDHSIIDWLEHTEAHIQKQRIIHEISPVAHVNRKKM